MERSDFTCKNCLYYDARAGVNVGVCILQPIERATFEYRSCGQGKFKDPNRNLWMNFGDWIYKDEPLSVEPIALFDDSPDCAGDCCRNVSG